MSTPIEQIVEFPATPEEVYHAYMRADEHAAFTGQPADITAEPGAAFSAHGGALTGRMIDLVPNQRIVQAWHVSGWPEGVFSLVRIDLEATSDGTRLTLHHDAFPDDAREHLDGGWHAMYWNPMQAYFKK